MTEIKMTLTKQQWKKMILEMLEKDEVSIIFAEKDTKVTLVKVVD